MGAIQRMADTEQYKQDLYKTNCAKCRTLSPVRDAYMAKDNRNRTHKAGDEIKDVYYSKCLSGIVAPQVPGEAVGPGFSFSRPLGGLGD